MKRFLALLLSVLIAFPLGTLSAFADDSLSYDSGNYEGDGYNTQPSDTTDDWVTLPPYPDTDVPDTDVPGTDVPDTDVIDTTDPYPETEYFPDTTPSYPETTVAPDTTPSYPETTVAPDTSATPDNPDVPSEINVIYVKEGATGNGSAADNALGTLAQATALAATKTADVTIKFVGTVTLDATAFTDYKYTEPAHANTITWTGNDASSKLVLKTDALARFYAMGGDLCIQDLALETDGKVFCLVTNLYDLTVEEGVTCVNTQVAIDTISIYGVQRQGVNNVLVETWDNAFYNATTNKHTANPNITIKSGSFKQVCGYMANASNKLNDDSTGLVGCSLDGKVTITISGANTSIYQVYAVCNAYHSVKDCEIILDGGVFARYVCASDRAYTGGITKYGTSGVTGTYTVYLTKNFDLSKQTTWTGLGSGSFVGLCGTTANKTYDGALNDAKLGTYVLKADAEIFDAINAEETKINKATFDSIVMVETVPDTPEVPTYNEIASGYSEGGLKWVLYDTGTLVISGNGAMQDYASPEEMPWYDFKDMISSVVIEEGVTSVGSRAFFDCKKIEYVILASTVSYVGAHAFRECMSLRSVNIPDGVTGIGEYAFRYCTSLEYINIPSSVSTIGEYAFYYCTSLMDLTLNSGLVSIGDSAFYYCISLGKLTLPSTLRSIGNYAFCECISLTGLAMRAGVERIGEQAFAKCSALNTVNIPSTVTVIGDSAFEECINLAKVTIGRRTEKIGAYAFCNCASLVSVNLLANGLREVGCGAFDGCDMLSYNEYGNALYLGSTSNPYYLLVRAVSTDIASCDINSATVVIGANAFSSCTNVTSVYIPDSVQYINRGALAGMNSLTSLDLHFAGFGDDGCENLFYLFSYDRNGKASSGEIPWSLAHVTVRFGYIVDNFFYECGGITSVQLSEGVTGIGAYAFYGCYSLRSITIPESVTGIGSYAFSCTGLEEIVIPGIVYMIGNSAFENCNSLSRVTIKDGVREIGGYAFAHCQALAEIEIPDSVTYLGAYAFNSAISLNRAVIGNGVYGIGDYAFADCCELRSLQLPSILSNIGNSAFAWCSQLVEIELPDGLGTIGQNAFRGCKSLSAVTVPASVGYIGACAFEDCTNLGEVVINANISDLPYGIFAGCTQLCSITLPDSLGRIGQNAFAYCEMLRYIDIPSTVNHIGDLAFEWCIELRGIDLSKCALRTIGTDTFRNCSALRFAHLPDGLSEISSWAFEQCGSLEYIVIPDSVNYVGVGAFSGCADLKSVTLSENMYGLCSYVFSFCESLTEIVLPYNISWIDEYAFTGCFSLEEITFSPSLSRIGAGAFSGCRKLVSVELPRWVYGIERGAFSGCSSIERIVIPYNFGFAFRELFSERAFELVMPFAARDNSVTPDAQIPESLREIVLLGGTIEEGYLDGCENVDEIVLSLEGESAYVNTPGITSYVGYGSITFGEQVVGAIEPEQFDNFDGSVTDIDGNSAFCIFWSYDEETGTLTFSGRGRMENVEDTSWRELAGLVRRIVIEDGVTSIMSGAFENFTSLESAEIAESVTVIGSYAFSSCSSLAAITLPVRLNAICERAFYECSSLTSVTIHDSVIRLDYGAFSNCYALNSVHIGSGIIRIESSAFENCYNLNSVYISEGVTEIGWSSFSCCYNLYNIRIPNTLERIDGGAFSACDAISYYYYNNGQYLGNETNNYVVLSALYSYTLEDVHPDTKILGQSAIRWGFEDTDVVIPEGIIAISVGAVTNVNAQSITLPSSVKSIGINAFSYSYNLREIYIPDGVEYMDNSILCDCPSLEKITIPYVFSDRFITLFGSWECPGTVAVEYDQNNDGEKIYYYVPEMLREVNIIGGELPQYAFAGMSTITDVTFTGVDSIPEYAFFGCVALRNVGSLDGISSMDAHAFEMCTGLESVVLPETLSDIGEYAFAGCAYLTQIDIPASVRVIREGTFSGCKRLLYITLPDNLCEIGDRAFLDCWLLRDIDIPYGVERIGCEAFANCTRFKHVVLPDSVTYLGSYAFYGCSRLIDVYMSRGVSELREMLFYGCDKLEKLVINEPVKYIDMLALYGADELTVHCVEDEYMTEFFVYHDIPYVILSEDVPVYLVVFYDRYGGVVESHTYKAGDRIVAPSYYDKYEDNVGVYKFTGWNTDEICTGYAEYTPQYALSYMFGDADGDLELSNADITLLVRAAAGWENSIIFDILDMDRNGKFNNRDIVFIIKKLAYLY